MSDRAYLRRRAVQEEELASTSPNAVVAEAHFAMASEYRRRLKTVDTALPPRPSAHKKCMSQIVDVSEGSAAEPALDQCKLRLRNVNGGQPIGQ